MANKVFEGLGAESGSKQKPKFFHTKQNFHFKTPKSPSKTQKFKRESQGILGISHRLLVFCC